MGKNISSDYSDSCDYVNNYVSDGKMTLTKNLPKEWIYYQDGPRTPKDRVGLFKEGKGVRVDEQDAFYYRYNAMNGFITIKPGMNTININYQSENMYMLRFKSKNSNTIRKIINQ